MKQRTNNNPSPALTEYEAALKALDKFCRAQTDLTPVIIDSEYPIRVQFVPDGQESLFGENENIDENGEFNDLTVSVGLSTAVKSTLRFKVEAKILKKMIKLAETVGILYYHAFREQEGERITPKTPLLKAMDGFTEEEASSLCCPGCGHPVVNQWARGTRPAFCQGCGQALDWGKEAREDLGHE